MIEIIALIFAFLMLTLGTFGRFKYVWQGNKVKRQESSEDVSRKFLLLTHIIYWIAFWHNIFIGDVVDTIFWSVGIITTAYANIMVYRYYPIKYPSVLRYIKDSFNLRMLMRDSFGIMKIRKEKR